MNSVISKHMKIKSTSLHISLVLTICFNTFAQNKFQGVDKLKVDSSMYFIQSVNEFSSKNLEVSLQQRKQKSEIRSFNKLSINRFIINGSKTKESSDEYYSDVFRNEQKDILIILPRIVVVFKDDVSVKKILNNYSGILELESGNQRKYILKCNLRKSEDVLRIVNELCDKIYVEWCEPELLTEIKIFNQLYPQQYYLKNTGQNGGTIGVDINVEPAWNITNGSSNIIVAVIDQGVDKNHEDLGDRVLDGYTIRYPSGIGAPQNENDIDKKGHGVACAGIIAASNNSIGIRGIASNSKIIPINIVPDYAFYDNYGMYNSGFGSSIEIAQAINWAWHRADVLSNSYSWGGDFYSNEIVSAIDSARVFGRGGKGTIVVFASGNGDPNLSDVSFPANVNGVVTVGALTKNGSIWDYSLRGMSMDLVAPSGNVNLLGDVQTIDRMGFQGYNTTNYMNNFGGTSAACPQIAGVVALMLSINPDLTESQIKTVLQNTARDFGSAGFDNIYGYGLVDANAAVNAILPSITGPSQICEQGTYTISNIPNGANVTWSCSPSGIVSFQSNGNSVTITKVGNGRIITLLAQIAINGAAYSISKGNISVGQPFTLVTESTSNLSYNSGADAYRILNSTGSYQYQGTLVVSDYYGLATNYSWSKIAGSTTKPIYWLPRNSDNSIIDIYSKYLNSYLVLECEASNSCGSYSQSFSFYTGTSPIFIMSPNPASSEVSITMSEDKSTKIATSFQVDTYEVQLWNSTGIVKKVQSDNKTVTVSLNGLSKGEYFVHILIDNKIVDKKILRVE